VQIIYVKLEVSYPLYIYRYYEIGFYILCLTGIILSIIIIIIYPFSKWRIGPFLSITVGEKNEAL